MKKWNVKKYLLYCHGKLWFPYIPVGNEHHRKTINLIESTDKNLINVEIALLFN